MGRTMSQGRLDLPRIGIATVLTGGLSLGLAVAFLRHAQGRQHVGPTSATLDEAFSALVGAAIGVALGSALSALFVRRGSPVLSGLIAGVAAYAFVLAPAFIITDDVGLAEDLNPGGIVFLVILLLLFGVFAMLGATVGGFIASFMHRGHMQRRQQH
jgi:hypothetical protein